MRGSYRQSASGLRARGYDTFNENTRFRGSRTIDSAIILQFLIITPFLAGFIVLLLVLYAAWRLRQALHQLGESMARLSVIDPDPGNPHEDTRANRDENEDADPR